MNGNYRKLGTVTVGEIMKGIVIKARADPAAAFQRWLDEMRVSYAARLLPTNDAVATNCGRLMAERTRPTRRSPRPHE